ncbi:MAG: hypothetical protein IJ145_04245 [Prevotella sp.]|nr:hypothetical protein [Prevotella sp.]
MDAMIKKWYIRKKHAPPVVDIVIYDDMDALLRRSVKTIDDNEDEFDDVIEGSTEPARSKESFIWKNDWDM